MVIAANVNDIVKTIMVRRNIINQKWKNKKDKDHNSKYHLDKYISWFNKLRELLQMSSVSLKSWKCLDWKFHSW